MQSPYIFPICMVVIITLFILLQYVAPTNVLSADIVDQTCQTCTLTASNISYDFCYASLASVPVSHATNLAGLGLISLELALEDATNTLQIIKGMLNKTESSLVCETCLEFCLELYSGISSQLEVCIPTYMSGEPDEIYLWIGAIMQAISICEEGFEGEGYKSPLTKENYALSQLSAIIICIINLTSPALKSGHHVLA